MQPRYVVGKVFHKKWMTDLEVELLQFPKSPHDDLADALAYLPQIAFPSSYFKEQIDYSKNFDAYEHFNRVLQDKLNNKNSVNAGSGLAL